MKLNEENILKFSLIILSFSLIFFIFINSISNENQLKNIEIKTNPYFQNKDEASYFILLEPDIFGNLKIQVDVIDYNQSYKNIFYIIQQENKYDTFGGGDDKEYQQFNLNLGYLYYNNKIYNLKYTHSLSVLVDFKDNENFISSQSINLSLPDNIEKNITDFSLLIFLRDEASKSYLENYPFDKIDTVVTFDFPNKSNINILLEMPKNYKSYNVKPIVYEQNKETGELKNHTMKKIFDEIYKIQSSDKIDHTKNYTYIEIKQKRKLFSFETISYFLIIFINIGMIYYLLGKHNINFESISFYIVLISIPAAIYLNNRPQDIPILTKYNFLLILLFLICLIIGIKKFNKK